MSVVEQAAGRRAAYLACILLVTAALYLGREILIPFALAAFLAFFLIPPVRAIERLRIGRVASVIIVVAVGFAVLVGLGGLVARQAAGLANAIPQYRDNISAKVRQLRASLPGSMSRASRAVEEIREEISGPAGGTDDANSATGPTVGPVTPELVHDSGAVGVEDVEPAPMKVQVVDSEADVLATTGRWLGPVVHPLGTAAITAVLVIFFLIYREDLRDRVIRACGRAHVYVTTAALDESGRKVTRFLAAQALANGLTGLAIGIGLFLIGLPDALLWGLLTASLRFVPFIGTWIAAFFPIAFSAAVSEGWLQPLSVLGWFLVVDLLSANFLEPYLYGARTGASPMAVLCSFVFWAWLWGGVGLLLATPITVCLIVLGKHVPALEIFYVLLSAEPALEPKIRFYQRLLAMDGKEALETARNFLRERRPVELFDEMVLPALAQLENDRFAKDVDEPRAVLARQVVDAILERIVADASESATEQPDSGKETAPAVVLLIAGGGAFDEAALLLLQHVAGIPGRRFETITSAALAAEIGQRVQNEQPKAVVVSAVEPRDVRRLTHICNRITAGAPACPILGLCASATDNTRRRCTRLNRLPNVETFPTLDALTIQLSRILGN